MLFDNNDLAPLGGGGSSPLYHGYQRRGLPRAALWQRAVAGGGGVKMVHFLKTMISQIKLPFNSALINTFLATLPCHQYFGGKTQKPKVGRDNSTR